MSNATLHASRGTPGSVIVFQDGVTHVRTPQSNRKIDANAGAWVAAFQMHMTKRINLSNRLMVITFVIGVIVGFGLGVWT